MPQSITKLAKSNVSILFATVPLTNTCPPFVICPSLTAAPLSVWIAAAFSPIDFVLAETVCANVPRALASSSILLPNASSADVRAVVSAVILLSNAVSAFPRAVASSVIAWVLVPILYNLSCINC